MVHHQKIEPEELPPSHWDAAVQGKRQKVLAERNKALPAQSDKKTGKNMNQNDVQIVDRSYLQKDFKVQSNAARLQKMLNCGLLLKDIIFLKTRIAGRRPEQPKLSEKEFRNVSIITALNAQKDRINELGSIRFAAETYQTLTHFYSIDRFGSGPDAWPKGRRSKNLANMSPIR